MREREKGSKRDGENGKIEKEKIISVVWQSPLQYRKRRQKCPPRSSWQVLQAVLKACAVQGRASEPSGRKESPPYLNHIYSVCSVPEPHRGNEEWQRKTFELKLTCFKSTSLALARKHIHIRCLCMQFQRNVDSEKWPSANKNDCEVVGNPSCSHFPFT